MNINKKQDQMKNNNDLPRKVKEKGYPQRKKKFPFTYFSITLSHFGIINSTTFFKIIKNDSFSKISKSLPQKKAMNLSSARKQK